jgi:hypothetical protein
VSLNRTVLGMLNAEASLAHTGRSAEVQIRLTTAVGAIPLISPLTGSNDLGLLVRPRFPWGGIGQMLTEAGMAASPTLLPVASLPQSDREVPAWVLSSVVLLRIERLLQGLNRRFEFREADLAAPRGTVNWQRWATVMVPAGHADSVPCRFPDLSVDSLMLGFVHHVLLLQREALTEQARSFGVAGALLHLCERLIGLVASTPPRRVAPAVVESWMRRPINSVSVNDALEAGLWTVEERGLAGASELSGLAWRLDMSAAFEAWLGALLDAWAPRHGFVVRSGSRQQTLIPLRWEPAYLGSQKSLIPDFVLQRSDTTLVIDAKYKGHWDELASSDRWSDLEQSVRDAHRDDLMQVLAYTTTQSASRVVGILFYPCREGTWARLKERGQWVNRAIVSAGERQVELVLTAVPLGTPKPDAFPLLDACLTV